MSPDAAPRGIRRVVAVVQEGDRGLLVLRAAAEIAARLHAEIQVLQITDTNLLRLAEQGMARMVSLFDAAGPLLPRDLASTFQRLTADAEATLRAAAQSFGLAWSFRVLHGQAAADVAASVADDELLVVDGGRALATADRHFATMLWAATADRPSALLMLDRHRRLDVPAVLVETPSPAASAALSLACSLLSGHDRRLPVLLPAALSEPATEAWVRDQAKACGRAVHFWRLAADNVPAIGHAARQAGAALLVVPAESGCLGEPDSTGDLIDRAGCSLLLWR